MPGWSETTFGVQSISGLPQSSRSYIKRLEELIGVQVHNVSMGQTVETSVLRYPFEASKAFFVVTGSF